MPGGYGTYHNGCAVGVFWDGIELSADGSQARITNARIKIDRNQNISDSSNKLSWSGGAITDGSDSNINVDGSGEKTVKSCSETWVTLSYTGTTSRAFDADFSGINYAGTTLTVDKNVTYPQRLYNLPATPAFVGVGYTGSLGNFTVNWVNGSTTDAPWTTLTLTRVEVDTGATTVISVPSPTTATSYAQTGLDPTKQYYWALAASNSRGTSPTMYSGTTPEPLHTLTMNYTSRAIGEAVTFTIDKHGSSYNSRIRIDDQTAYATGAATSAVYTFTQAPWESKIPSLTSKNFTVYLDTYTTAGDLIGTNTYTITVTVPSIAPYLPTANIPSVAETVTAISTAFTAGVYIQGYSVIRVTHSGAAGASASITKKEVIVNGLTYDVTSAGYADIPVTWNTSPTAQSRTTDSRGRVATSATTTVVGHAYSKPVITNFKVERCNSAGVLANDGTYVKFTINVASTSVLSGTEKNKLNYTVHLAVNGVASGSPLTSKVTDTPLTYSGTTGALGAGAYSASASYSFILTVTDKLATSTTTRIVSIPTEIVPLSIGNNGIAIGKVYNDATKALDVIGDTKLGGALEVTGILTLPNDSISADAIGDNLDIRYYTEAEVNALLLTKANSTHDHDDRYFTEAEVNTLLEDKASKAEIAYPKFVTYYLSADSAMLTGSNYVSVAFNTKGETSGDFNVTWVGHTFAVPVTGIYEIVLQISWTSDSTSGNRQQLLYKNPAQTTLNSSSGPTLLAGGYTGGVMKTQKYAPSSDMTGGVIYWKGLVLASDRFMPYVRTTSSTRVAGGTWDSQVTITLERPM